MFVSTNSAIDVFMKVESEVLTHANKQESTMQMVPKNDSVSQESNTDPQFIDSIGNRFGSTQLHIMENAIEDQTIKFSNAGSALAFSKSTDPNPSLNLKSSFGINHQDNSLGVIDEERMQSFDENQYQKKITEVAEEDNESLIEYNHSMAQHKLSS